MSKRLAELLGIHLHKPEYFDPHLNRCECGAIFSNEASGTGNPDLSDPIVLLRIARGREWWPKFCNRIGRYEIFDDGLVTQKDWELLDIDYLLTPGKLSEALEEFLEAQK